MLLILLLLLLTIKITLAKKIRDVTKISKHFIVVSAISNFSHPFHTIIYHLSSRTRTPSTRYPVFYSPWYITNKERPLKVSCPFPHTHRYHTVVIIFSLEASKMLSSGTAVGVGPSQSMSSQTAIASSYSNERPPPSGGAASGIEIEYASDPASGSFFTADYKK